MTTKLSVLKRAGEVVAAVASAFGGFLLNVEPPDDILPHFTTGFAAAIATLVFLAISLLAELLIAKKQYKILFLSLSIPLMIASGFAGLRYQEYFYRHTIPFPTAQNTTVRTVISDQMTAYGNTHYKGDESLTSYLLGHGGLEGRERNWTRESLIATTRELDLRYVILSVLLSASVFCLLEGLVPSKIDAPEDLPSKESEAIDESQGTIDEGQPEPENR